jgi:hypothetical protein
MHGDGAGDGSLFGFSAALGFGLCGLEKPALWPIILFGTRGASAIVAW